MTQGENLSSKVVGKVTKLVSMYQQEQEKNNNLQQMVNRRDEEIDVLKSDILALKEEVKALKLGEAIKGSEGTAEASQKINALVREIDKCIALLNQ